MNINIYRNFPGNCEDALGFYHEVPGGMVTMPIEEVSWTGRFGMRTDKFGISWMVSCE